MTIFHNKQHSLIMKKFTLSILSAALFCGVSMAQDRELYFSIGEDNIDNGAEVTLFAGQPEFSMYTFADSFTTNIIAHVDVAIKGNAQVSIVSLDEKEITIFPSDSEDNIKPLTMANTEWKVNHEFRALPGQKKEFTVILPVISTTGEFQKSARARIEIGRPECEEGCFPVIYDTVETFTLVLSNNPADVFPTDEPGPVDPPSVSVSQVLSDDNQMAVAGNTLYYQFETPQELSVYSVNGSQVYSGVAGAEGMTSFDFLPAGLYIYKAGDTTGKILIK